uniref:DUF569 domain-containing protein n=1 Tax=Opuntia streptacantha TaxID=393608 RepID=A0A7C8YSH3_OPUST
MEYFIQSKFVRLRTCRHKFLVAGDDGESVKQSSHGHTKKAQWTVELINNKPNMIRLRSCHNKLLTASDEPFLLGWTGKRVLQTVQTDCNPAVQWEPIRKDFYVKLRAAQTGKFLRANRGTPPWKGSVTVDIPERRTTRKWVLWQVDILDADVGVDRGLWPRNCKSLQPATNANATAAYKSSYSIMANEEPRESSTASSSEDEEDEDRSVWSDETEGVDLPTSSSSSVYKVG